MMENWKNRSEQLMQVAQMVYGRAKIQVELKRSVSMTFNARIIGGWHASSWRRLSCSCDTTAQRGCRRFPASDVDRIPGGRRIEIL